MGIYTRSPPEPRELSLHDQLGEQGGRCVQNPPIGRSGSTLGNDGQEENQQKENDVRENEQSHTVSFVFMPEYNVQLNSRIVVSNYMHVMVGLS